MCKALQIQRQADPTRVLFQPALRSQAVWGLWAVEFRLRASYLVEVGPVLGCLDSS